MKAVILAGGRGTRISEESTVRPKPMIEIGGRPILWHIMKIYSSFGVNEFVICLGYKGEQIKEFFVRYAHSFSDLTLDLAKGEIDVRGPHIEPWVVHLVDTGLDTNTGGRLQRVRDLVKDDPCLMMTYGDGVADVDIDALLRHHRKKDRLATMTVVHPPARFGSANIVDGVVTEFIEKPQAAEGLINGGFFVMKPEALDYIEDDASSWEFDALPKIVDDNQLAAYTHHGFWQPMDTMREKWILNNLVEKGQAPWITWEQ